MSSEMKFAKGVGVGLIVGSAVGMMVPHKKMSRSNVVSRALKTMGEVIENVTDVMGI